MKKISVIIATYNRCSSLEKVLADLEDQEQDGAFTDEVIVVDNNSHDGTPALVQAQLGRWEGRLKYFREPQQGKPYALNKGVREAKGDIIAFLDDDVTLDKRWLFSLAECFKAHNCDGVGGRVLPVYTDATPGWIRTNPNQAAGVVVICDHGGEIKRFIDTECPFIGTNFAFRREVFDECGLFRTDLSFGRIALGEDTEFANRVVKKNKVLYYCGKALVWHPVDLKRARLISAARWHIALGRFAAKMEQEEGAGKFACFGRVPRYLFRGLARDLLHLLFSVFDPLSFFNARRSFFRKVGMIQEYRKQKNY